VAAGLSLVAVVVAVDPFGTGGSNVALLPVLACFIAGILVSGQQAVNGRVAQASGSAIAAAWVNFTVGGTMLWALTLGRDVDLSGTPSPLDEPLLWTGGLLGTLFVVTAAWIVRILGVLLLTLTTIAGQLLGALVMDVVFPTPGRPITLVEVLGVLLTFVAVAIGTGRHPRPPAGG